jgi:polysaccharide export outer membrane protein
VALVVLGGGFSGNVAAQASSQPYRVGAQDVLDIFVWREEDLTKPVIVRPDGGISFPLAGELVVAGRTVKEIQDELTKRIQAYVPEAVVTVSVSQIASYRIYILGKVNNPGEYVLGTYIDVAKALSIAKGLNPYADQGSIRIIRRQAGGEHVFKFNYADVIQGNNLEQNIMLQSGDTIIVP